MAIPKSSPARGLKVRPYAETLREASRKTHWIVSTDAPKTVDDLTFTSRDEQGRIRWWDVVVPRTDYCAVHRTLGRAYAFEVLDLLNNPDAEASEGQEHHLGFICDAIARWMKTVSGAATYIGSGFFEVVSEYVATGTARR